MSDLVFACSRCGVRVVVVTTSSASDIAEVVADYEDAGWRVAGGRRYCPRCRPEPPRDDRRARFRRKAHC